MQSFAGYAQALWGWGSRRLPRGRWLPHVQDPDGGLFLLGGRGVGVGDGGSRGLFGSHAGWLYPRAIASLSSMGPPTAASDAWGPPPSPSTRCHSRLSAGPGTGSGRWALLHVLTALAAAPTAMLPCHVVIRVHHTGLSSPGRERGQVSV